MKQQKRRDSPIQSRLLVLPLVFMSGKEAPTGSNIPGATTQLFQFQTAEITTALAPA
ncbi:hypothetical protein ACFFGY_11460 [Roseomonas elaeocarpi]|uniref:Uncharacterized protein n=1 Tax=Roseomonas elaeocarpi TaxID=907779 RepID=A0ABV6JUA1_9PROT